MSFTRHAHPFPLSSIQITSPFWGRWQDRLARTTLGIQYAQCKSTGRLENFARAARGEQGTFEGRVYNDSDVYKWVEAGATLRHVRGPNPELDAQLDEVVSLIVAAQAPDGYLNTYFQVNHPDQRWVNLGDLHELYCLGHLYEAAAALVEATGDRRLIDVARKSLAHVASIFGPDRRAGYCGHPEFELAVFRLIPHLPPDDAAVGEALVRWMIDIRGVRPTPIEAEHRSNVRPRTTTHGNALAPDAAYDGKYIQDHAPVRETDGPVGHSVRAMYLYAGATDAAIDRDDAPLENALTTIYDRLVQRQMYITGGIGPIASYEGFADDYVLPNRTAYAETCAACGLVFWARRMGLATGEGRYVDVMERALFNGALAGISLTGDRFFYVNPLASDGTHHRQEWFDCACCPSNIARLIAGVGRYAVAKTDDGVQIDLPIGLVVQTEVRGQPVTVRVESDYPWSGEVSITIETAKPLELELRVRIPDWCPELEVDGPGDDEWTYDRDYAVLKRTWESGDEVKLDLAMPTTLLQAHPAIEADRGRRAVQRGPLVYCLEEVDLGCPAPEFILDPTSEWDEVEMKLGDEPIVALEASGDYEEWPDADVPYTPAELDRVPKRGRWIPYYAWDNRRAGSMEVWVRTDR